MPRLERPSVVVMDTAPYHNTKTDESFYPKTKQQKSRNSQMAEGEERGDKRVYEEGINYFFTEIYPKKVITQN